MKFVETIIMILEKFVWLKKSYSYENYREMVISNALHGTTTGPEQLSERIEATKINAQRMSRIDKQVNIKSEITEIISKLTQKWIWVVIAESWCGDASQNLPIIAKMAKLSPNIELRIVLRDQHPELIDSYLTNGTRSIPKLICFNSETRNEIGIWGPRPKKIQDLVNTYKANYPGCTHNELVNNIHLNYGRDRGEAIQEEFLILLKKWIVEID